MNLELYLDSYLKRFGLFTTANEILKRYSQPEIQQTYGVDENMARDLFAEFVDLATHLDTYENWTETQWTNFLMMMLTAYKEKGKGISVNCALAALGLTVTTPVVVDNQWVGPNDEIQPNMPSEEQLEEGEWKLTSFVNVQIDSMSTPNVDKFMDKLRDLLRRLLWLHTPVDTSDSAVQKIDVDIRLITEYTRVQYTTNVFYSECEMTEAG